MKATKAEVLQRVDEILRIRLDGAEFWDVRQYVAEKQAAQEVPWTIAEGGKPLSERTLWWYIQQADELVAQSCRVSRKRSLRRHLAQRRSLYARAVNAADNRTALAVLRDEAELMGLYPATKREITGPNGTAIPIQVIEVVRGDTTHASTDAHGGDAGRALEIQLPPRPAEGVG